MPDIVEIIQTGAANPWFYLPAALLLGALHALEPGHSKSLMAAFIIAVRGTPFQAVVLGVCAAIGHTIIICALAIAGLWLGDKLILEKAEPWLILITGLLVIAIAVRVWMTVRGGALFEKHGGAAHDADSHDAAHADDIEKRLAGRRITSLDIAWFGFTAGLLPCPAAFAVLLVCLQLKEFTLGIAMVAAFSAGLAVSLVSVGVAAAWGARTASRRISGFDRWAHWLPYASVAVLMTVGLAIFGRGVAGIVAA